MKQTLKLFCSCSARAFRHADAPCADDDLIRTIGATLGGPIIKNKLFFFTNFEMNDQPGQAIRTNGIGKGITEAQLKAVQDKLVKDYGYNPGSYTDFPGGTQNMKILARIDWNISQSHKLALRFNHTQNLTVRGGTGMFQGRLPLVFFTNMPTNSGMILNQAVFSGPDKRYNYNAIGNYKYGKSTAYVLTNTNKGYGWIANVTLRATPVRNLDLMVAYTHTVNKEISGMPGSNATSAYTGLYSVNGPNFATLQSSQYVVPDKVMANISYFLPFKVFGGNGLHLNLYYSGYSAGNYSYIYSNDMNGDGISADMMYIPASKDELRFASDADKNAFWAFLEQDKYLSSHKGQYAEDFAFKIGKTKHNFQLSVSIDNIGNMINSSWGVTRWSCYTTSNGTFTNPVLKLSAVEDGTPVFSMNKVGDSYPTQTWNKYYKNPSECWQLLFGLKYYFN